MGGAVSAVTNVVKSVAQAVFKPATQPAQPTAPTAQVAKTTQTYSAGPEMRGTEQDAQNAIDFQNNASRRRASGYGAQMLASSGTTGSNAGTKTLLGS